MMLFLLLIDTFGHDVGDVILQRISDFLQRQIRASDIACRFGGEEMLLIFPGSSLEDVRWRAEQLPQLYGQSDRSLRKNFLVHCFLVNVSV